MNRAGCLVTRKSTRRVFAQIEPPCVRLRWTASYNKSGCGGPISTYAASRVRSGRIALRFTLNRTYQCYQYVAVGGTIHQHRETPLILWDSSRTLNQRAAGSSPATPTIKSLKNKKKIECSFEPRTIVRAVVRSGPGVQNKVMCSPRVTAMRRKSGCSQDDANAPRAFDWGARQERHTSAPEGRP